METNTNYSKGQYYLKLRVTLKLHQRKAVHIYTKTEECVRFSSCGVIKRRDRNKIVRLYCSKYNSSCSRALVKDRLLVPMVKNT